MSSFEAVGEELGGPTIGGGAGSMLTAPRRYEPFCCFIIGRHTFNDNYKRPWMPSFNPHSIIYWQLLLDLIRTNVATCKI